jgi:hypothetical protein
MPKNTTKNIEEDGSKKIKIENLLNPTKGLEESIEDSRTIPLDKKFIHEFLKTNSTPSRSPSPKNSEESCESSSPYKSTISSIFPSLDFDSRSPS